MSPLSIEREGPENRMVAGVRDGATERVLCLSYVHGHHVARSGYHHLARHLNAEWHPSRLARLLGETALRIPAKLLSQHCGIYEYSRHSATAEIELLVRSLAQQSWTVHHLYGEKSFLLLARLRGLRRDRQIASFHHHPERFPLMVTRTRHLERLDHAIVVSSEQMEYVESLVGRGKVSVIPHGVDTEYWCPDSLQRPDKVRLVFAGSHMRDFDTLEEVIRNVLATCSDVEFVLLSSDLRCSRFREWRRVRWMYRVSDEAYRKQMQGATLLVLPLTYSTAVNSVLEALACGVPVITTRGGISDYLDSCCGIELERGDAAGMVDAIISLLNSNDLDRRREAARAKALEFDWPRVAEQVRQVYATVC